MPGLNPTYANACFSIIVSGFDDVPSFNFSIWEFEIFLGMIRVRMCLNHMPTVGSPTRAKTPILCEIKFAYESPKNATGSLAIISLNATSSPLAKETYLNLRLDCGLDL